jgi:hypothetical protein
MPKKDIKIYPISVIFSRVLNGKACSINMFELFVVSRSLFSRVKHENCSTIKLEVVIFWQRIQTYSYLKDLNLPDQ